MNKYAKERLEKIENYIKLDTIRIKYLKEYLSDINNKMNDLVNKLKIDNLTFEYKEQIKQKLNIYTCYRNEIYNDINELTNLLKSVSEEKQLIIEKDGNCVFKID